MTLHRSAFSRRARLCAQFLAAIPLGCLLFALNLHAQSASSDGAAETKTPQMTVTVFLNNINDQHDLTEAQNALRSMLPHVRVYADYSDNAIAVQGTSDEVAEAQKLIAELDKPQRIYRVTYTLTDTEADKPSTSRHVTLVVLSGAKGVLKQGTRVPLITGTTEHEAAPGSTQVQYIDVGLNIEASIDSSAQAVRLSSRIEESSVAEERSGIGTQDPVIRQTKLEQTSTLVPGKPLELGSLDVPGTTHHEEVEVVAELLR